MKRLLPRSLLGQVLLSVALALFVAQGISAFLQFREAERRREFGSPTGLPSSSSPNRASRASRGGGDGRARTWTPLLAGEDREAHREAELQAILVDQGVEPAHRSSPPPDHRERLCHGAAAGTADPQRRSRWSDGNMIVAALQQQAPPSGPSRVPEPKGARNNSAR